MFEVITTLLIAAMFLGIIKVFVGIIKEYVIDYIKNGEVEEDWE